MPAISGYRCDGPKCYRMAETNPPNTWLRLVIPSSIPVMAQGGGRNEERSTSVYLCSNGCLSRYGKQRYNAAVDRGEEKRPGRALKPTGGDA